MKPAMINYLIQHALSTIDLETIHLMQDEVACQFPSPGEIRRTDLPESVKALRDTLCVDIGAAPDIETARSHLFAFAAALDEHLAALRAKDAP